MKRACAALAVALLCSLHATARTPDPATVIPVPARATLCAGAACDSHDLAPGTRLDAFLTAHARPGASWRLRLDLPEGEFALRQTWLIDGAVIPQQITELTIAGAPTSTRLSGATSLGKLGARTSRTADGALAIELPTVLRTRLMSQRYADEDAAWPVLLDRTGALRLAQWPTDGWSAFARPAASAADPWIPLDRTAPAAAWRDEESAWVQGFFRHGWHDEYERLAGIRTDAPALRLDGAPRYGIGTSGRLRVLNLRSELRAPGEYWIDARRGRLLAIPRAGHSADTLRLTTLETPLIELRGVRNARLERLGFADTRGHALVVSDSENVELAQLAFERIGRSGVVVDGGHAVHVSDSTFLETGSHAVVLRGGDRGTLSAAGHLLENSRIVRPSQRLATPATGVRVEGVGQIVRGNTIEEAPHSAVYFDGNDHLIESNWIERVCLEVDDAGAIYAGRDWTYRGNIIRSNVIAALPRRGGSANLNGVYLDDMLSGTRVERNLIFDVPRGVLVGGGRDNVLEDNLFVRTTTSIHVDQRALEWASPHASPGGALRVRLGGVPYRDARWRKAYPALADILTQQPARPLNNVASGNASLDAGSSIVAAAAEGSVENPAPLGRSVADRGSAREFLASCARQPACAERVARMRLPMNPLVAARRETP